MGRDKLERAKRGEISLKPVGPQRPFATIPVTLLAARRVRELSGIAVRVLIWAEAGWNPNHGVVMSQHHLAKSLNVRRAKVSSAIRKLLAAELFTMISPSIRPGVMGSSGPGRAAIYDLPHRHYGSVVRFNAGDRRLQGYLKMWSTDLRSVAAQISDAAARVFLIIVAVARKHDGSLSNAAEPLDLTSRRLARDLPGMSERTARRAVAEICELGLLRLMMPRMGRRAAQYQPAGVLVTRIARRKHRRAFEKVPASVAVSRERNQHGVYTG